MAETFPHPDGGVEPDREAPTGISRWQKVVAILGVLVVLWVGDDTYKVIQEDFGGGGPGGGGRDHGPGQNAPPENQDRETDDNDGGGHAPGPPAGGHR